MSDSDNLEVIDSLPGSDPEKEDGWVRGKIDRDNQRKDQRGLLFWVISGISLVFYIVFLWHLICVETITALLNLSPHSS